MKIDPKKRICNLLPSKGTETDWKIENAAQSGAVSLLRAIPPSVDLRAAWWNIGDQEITGSCVGWASTDGLMRYHMHKAGKLLPRYRLSPRYTWMASKETDPDATHATSFIEEAGTYLKTAMDVCRKWGVVLETLLPFHINTFMYVDEEPDFYAAASQRRATAYYNLGKDLTKWRTWLASHGPILAGLKVDKTWDSATATHGLLDKFKPPDRGGHAVCIVGYKKMDQMRFIIRNSWGTGWGDKGFGYATEAYINDAFFSESYGITV
jgi:C1A family cysteine protease